MTLHRTKWIHLATCAALLALPLLSTAAQAKDQAEPKLIQRAVSWHLEDGVSHGVHLVRVEEDELVQRLLVAPASGDPLVVSERLDARTGLLVATVVDDATGWWARFTTDLGVQGEDLQSFFQRGRDEIQPDSPVRLQFETSSGVRVMVDAQSADDSRDALLKTLREQNLLRPLGQDVPEELRQPLLLLAGSFGDVHGTHELGAVKGKTDAPLIDVLAEALQEGTEDAWEIRAPMQLDELTKGPDLTSDQVRAVLARFQHVDPVDPLRSTVPGAGGR